MADITKSEPIRTISTLRVPPVALRWWATRGVWLGVVAWAVALGGLSLLGAEPGRTWGMINLGLAGVLAVVAWGQERPLPGLAPLVRGEPLITWDLTRVIGFTGVGLAAILVLAANSQYLAHPAETFGLAGVLWLASMGALIGATATWPRAAPAAPAADAAAPAADAAPATITPPAAPPAWTRWEVALFLGLVGLALLARVWDLRDFPYAIHGDEVLTGRNAIMGYFDGRAAPIFGTLWDGHQSARALVPRRRHSLKARAGSRSRRCGCPRRCSARRRSMPFYGLVRGAWGRAAALGGHRHPGRQRGPCPLQPRDAQQHRHAVLLGGLLLLPAARPAPPPPGGLGAGRAGRRPERVHLLRHAPAALHPAGLRRLPAGRPLAARAGAYLGHFALLALGYLAAFGPLLAYFLHHIPTSILAGAPSMLMLGPHPPRPGRLADDVEHALAAAWRRTCWPSARISRPGHRLLGAAAAWRARRRCWCWAWPC